jgi:hypothetical protein
MVTRIPAQERHFVDLSWMQAYWLFSYGEWFVPDNVHLGMLRAFNDDLIQSKEDFGMHFHEELGLSPMMSGNARPSTQVRCTASLQAQGRGTRRGTKRVIRPNTIRSGSSPTSPG